MSTQLRARQLFHYRSFRIDKGQPLGHGSYGAVYKAKYDQLPCATKVLHPTIMDPLDPGAGKIMERFEQECAFLESIRHPSIVLYLGMSRDAESGLPVLLMELLDESLTKMLECSPKALAFFVEVDICHDIALAIAYLHSNDIIHRDLSSNNVLMVAKRRAKVTDFGMSRISGAAPSMTPLTLCPGTLVYMSPEALNEPPTYTKKLDCFSEGVLMIQVCTRLWPEPGPRTITIQDARSPTGIMQMPVLERERRMNHIDKVDRSHGLMPIAMDCLHYQENERPSSEELCERLAGLKETREYRESKEQVEREQNATAKLERQVGVAEIAERAIVQQLREENQRLLGNFQLKKDELQTTERLIQRINQEHKELEEHFQSQIQDLNTQLEKQKQVTAETQQANYFLQQQLSQQNQNPSQPPSLVAVEAQVSGGQIQLHHSMEAKESQREIEGEQYDIQSKEEQFLKTERQVQELNRQLEEQEQVTAEIQHSLQRQVEQLQQQLSQQNQTPSQLLPAVAVEAQVSREHVELQQVPQPSPHPPEREMTVGVWKNEGTAPFAMIKGAVVVYGDVAYFMNQDGSVCSYNKYQRWHKLPKCPCQYSSLAVIRGILTAIGGLGGALFDAPQNKLLRLVDNKWVEYFPPMPTKRCDTAAITTDHHLIVAGGRYVPNRRVHFVNTVTVEVMDIETLIWSTVASLPHPYSGASAAICDDHFYMLGGYNKDGFTKSVLTCSLTNLLQSSSQTSSHSVWNSVCDAPVYQSTCEAIYGELLAVGGRDEQRKSTSAVYKYDPTADSWDLISNMPSARYNCLVAFLPTNEILLVGGQVQGWLGTSRSSEAKVADILYQ